jgi:predicted Zn-ribbon and HTH transcriptional regulator
VFSAQTEVTVKAVSKKPRYEVADIFRAFSEVYCKKHNLPLSHLKVMHAIQVCRTAALGGHRERCDSCGFERNAYNSCRNRHCPKCQALTKAKWLERRKAELLSVKYFHNVFTLPHEINPLARCNKKVLYSLLFKAVADTLEEFAANTGGKIGFIAILHTWDQKLLSHLHIHCLIPAGFLSFDRSSWIHTKNDFLFSVKALSKVFRGKFIDFLRNSYKDGSLEFPSFVSHLRTEKGFSCLINQLWKKEWYVYSKESFSEPEYVLDYLGRYTHRVAIANHRIARIDTNLVTFWYKDRSDGEKRKTIPIAAEEFIRRFLLHVLPHSFMRIRYYGFMANRCRKENLVLCKKLIGLEDKPVETHEEGVQEIMLKLTGVDILACPCCEKGRMRKGAELSIPILENWYVPQTKPEINDSS